MPPPIAAVMLKAFAELVAAETGRRISQEVAKKFISLVFRHLATKDDIDKAVEQINRFTAQKFDDLSREEILSPVMAAQAFLRDFETITSKDCYDHAAAYDVAFAAYEACTAAMGRVAYLSSIDGTFMRSNAVMVAKLIVTEIGAAAAVASANSSFERVLARRLVDDANILRKVSVDIENWEIPAIIREWTDFYYEPRLPREAFAIREASRFRAWLSYQSGRDGVQTLFKSTPYAGELKELVFALRNDFEAIVTARRDAIAPTVQVMVEAADALSAATISQIQFIADPPLAAN